jgi:hypothetical protein
LRAAYVFEDGSPVPPDVEVVPQADTGKPLAFVDGRWSEVRRTGTFTEDRNGHPGKPRLVPAPEGPTTNGHVAPDLLAGLKTGRWLDEQQFAPLQYSVPGIVPEGLSLLAGAPKVGKSWLTLSWSLALASGGKALGSVSVGPARPTFYLALEDGDRRLQDRCRKLLEGDAIPEGFEYILRVEPHLVIPTLEAWLDRHGDERPLVMLDTLGKVMPPALPGETTYGRDYRVGSALHDLCDDHPGASLLINHHDRKAGSTDFVATVSGTYGIAGACDTILVLVRERHQTTGVLKVTGRDVPEDEYALAFKEGGAWTLDGPDLAAASAKAEQGRAVEGLGDRAAEVAAFVLARPEGARAADVARGLEGIDEHTARTYLGRLTEAGRIIRVARGLYMGVASDASIAFKENTSISPVASDVVRNTRNGRNTPSVGATGEGWTEADHPSMCVECGQITRDRDPENRPRHKAGCP